MVRGVVEVCVAEASVALRSVWEAAVSGAGPCQSGPLEDEENSPR